MITGALIYLFVAALGTCIARGQGWIPDAPRAQMQAPADTTETPEELDTALACKRSPPGPETEVRLWP